MRFLQKTKDGGPDSTVDAYFLIEIKGLFSIALLKFNKGGRNVYHTHAFNALTWFISGNMLEMDFWGGSFQYKRSIKPKFTSETKNHRVHALRDSWCLTLRGPWSDIWTEDEYIEGEKGRYLHTIYRKGRKVVSKQTYKTYHT